eukprot:SAG22_NODE_1451_length_4395_cov_4.435987_2_plen_67_part_00
MRSEALPAFPLCFRCASARTVSKTAPFRAVRLLPAVSRRFRVLALSATPGKDAKKIQAVFDNLGIR